MQVDSGADRLPSRREDREGFVSPELHELSIVSLDTIGHQFSEIGGEVGGRFVAVLLRVARVPTDVGDQEGAESGWSVAHDSVSMPRSRKPRAAA